MTDRVGVPLEVGVHEAGSARVVTVGGDLVISNRESLREAVEKALADGAGRVVVDAVGLTHVDTPCFALLVQLSDRAREAGRELVVASLPPAFATLARELRLDEAITFADSVERALDPPGG